MGDEDVLETGDLLLASLDRLGCRLVVHGHKHMARLSYLNGMAVLASGSLSAMLIEFSSSFANTFHIITVEGDSPHDIRGTVKTWAFRYGIGWHPATELYCGLPHVSGFGNTINIALIAEALINLSLTGASSYSVSQVHSAAPSLNYLAPSERMRLSQLIRTSGLKLLSQGDGNATLWKEYAE